eukprot:jgi/Astpho2/1064/e_gw1.00017.33.1_t
MNKHSTSTLKDTRLLIAAQALSLPPYASLQASDPVDEHSTPAFKRTRLLTFAVMWIGYASFYITRTSLNYVTPTMMKDASLGIHYTEIGALTSIMPIAYGASKFLSGVLGSKTSPRILLAGGLAAAALVNVAFGCGSALWWFVLFWGLNGLLQGLGAPACARTITAWFSGKERGTYWGFWTASNNVGGFLAPLVAGTAARHYGWRAGMWAPGAVGVAVAGVILLFMKDSPEAAGFHPIEQAQGKKGGLQVHRSHTTEKRSMKEILVDECLRNPQTLLFAMSYFCVYIVRTGVTAWFIHYLIKAKGLDTAAAAVRVSGLELGGLAGSLSAGALSDLLVRKFPDAPAVGLRVRVVVAYAAATAAALAAFAACPNQSTLQWLAVAAVGFALYGPQMLVGLCGAEVVSPSAVGASQGFLGSISYIGSSMAGLPLSLILQHYGWGALFTSLIAACGLTVALLLPLLNAQSYTQRAAKAA